MTTPRTPWKDAARIASDAAAQGGGRIAGFCPEAGPGEINICGVVIHLNPARAQALRVEIAAMAGVEIHVDDGDARLVATAVDEGETLALEQIAAINRLPGVVSTSLVYHAFDIAD
jgi:nitrate reductase NapD